MANVFTLDYLNLLENDQISLEFRSCLGELFDGLLTANCENIESILLYGGLVRDGKSFDEWSDIDIIMVFKNIAKRDAVKLAELLRKLEQQYSIRVDLTQISADELKDARLLKCCVNSELLNAISMREKVSMLVFGQLPCCTVDVEQEKQAAAFYIANTLGLFRRYLVEVLYREDSKEEIKVCLKRVTRWVFSMVRASLRLFNIYTHPYEYCFPYLNRLFPEYDFSLLKRLAQIRKNMDIINVTMVREIIPDVESFVERYARLSLEKYADEIERNK